MLCRVNTPMLVQHFYFRGGYCLLVDDEPYLYLKSFFPMKNFFDEDGRYVVRTKYQVKDPRTRRFFVSQTVIHRVVMRIPYQRFYKIG